MKKAELLEHMVRNSDTIYANAITKQGKWSKYPDYFQVVSLTYDGKSAKIRGVMTETRNCQYDEQDNIVRDENNRPIEDTRPLKERTKMITFGRVEVVPFRIIAECNTPTEHLFVEAEVARLENLAKEREQYREQRDREYAIRNALEDALAGAIDYDKDEDHYGGRGLRLSYEQMQRLTEILTTARVGV